jgi:dTDP-4-dehydrorhamnose reductase
MKKLLITGASGFVGQNLCAKLKDKYEITGTYFTNPIEVDGVKKQKVDLSRRDEILQLIYTLRPHIIINAGAMSDPNSCEQNPEKAYKMNVSLNEQIAELSEKENLQFVSFSSDLIFNGENPLYKEEDDEKSICEYGMQKRLSEIITLKEFKNAIILRVPPMYGLTYGNSKCFLSGMLENLKNGKPVHLFSDEYRSFELVDNIIEAIEILIEKEEKGIFNVAGNEELSRLDFGNILCEVFGFDKSLLIKSKQADVDMPAQRPPNVCLNIEKITNLGYKTKSTVDKLKWLKNKL